MDIPVKEWLWPNWTTFVVTLAVLAFSYYLFKKHLWEPTRAFVKKRENFIAKNIKDSKDAKLQSESELEKAQKHLNKTIEESNKYLDAQMNEASKKAQTLIENAKVDIENMKVSTREALATAEVQAAKKLKEEVAKLSVAAASKILEKEIDSKTSKKLVNDFIKDIK